MGNKSNDIPNEFRHLEIKGNNFLENDTFGMKVTSRGVFQNITLGGQILFNKKEKTTFERAVKKNGREKCHHIQLIKSKCIHSEFHKEIKIMICEYFVEVRIIDDATYKIGKDFLKNYEAGKDHDIKRIPSKKSFEEECQVKPTEKEWNRALKLKVKKILKLIKFLDNFEKYESFSFEIPLEITSEDKKRIYSIIKSPEFLERNKREESEEKETNQIRNICKKYYQNREEVEETEDYLDVPNKNPQTSKFKEKLRSFFEGLHPFKHRFKK
jgi:hypothetical protein